IVLQCLLESLAAEEQTFRKLVLSACNSLSKRRHAVPKRQQCCLQKKKIAPRRTRRIQKGIELRIIFRRSGVVPIDEGVAIQIDVVLICPPKPAHSIWIEDMDED